MRPAVEGIHAEIPWKVYCYVYIYTGLRQASVPRFEWAHFLPIFIHARSPGHKSAASIPPERQGRVLRRDVHGMDSRIVSQLRIRQISVES